MSSSRVSHEAIIVNRLRAQLTQFENVLTVQGQNQQNRFDIPGWELQRHQQFQFGDLRIETPSRTVVVELESAGGLTNLVKYWPLLELQPPTKRLVLLHVFHLVSEEDYIAHRRLWSYTVERMREYLESRGVHWPDGWEAALLTYRTESDLHAVERAVRGTLGV